MNDYWGRSLDAMGFLPLALALAACVALVGCLGGDDQPAQPSAGANTALPECPGGEDDLRSASFDLGENPQGFPTAREALERFLMERSSDLGANSFERAKPGGEPAREANFSYRRDGLELPNVYVERLEGGWLVISYTFCRGTL
jgi:hypothetical protein